MIKVRLKRALRVVAFLSVGVFAASSAFAQSVSVGGNTRVETETIRSYFTLQPGESLDQLRVDRGVRDLLATGLFRDVKARRTPGGVVVNVVENDIVNRVTFSGNSKIKTDVLTGEIQTRSRGPFSRSQIDADVERLREVYKRGGRGDAKVEAKLTDAGNGRTDVTFVIIEGDKTGVASINFVGNNAFSGYRLRNLMTTTESNFLSFLKSSDIYDPDRIASDLELIRRYYMKNGYADFRVVGSDVQYDAAAKGYIITITLDEGERYRFSTVDVDSRIADVDVARLKRVVKTSAGDVYNSDAIEKSIEAINAEVAARGYAFAQVKPRGDRDTANKTINVSYVVEQGPRVYVERINVRGNTRTRDYVIRREFDLGEGDAYNRILIDKAERRLKNLGYFKTVKISNEPGSAPDRVVVNVDVEDQSTGAFSIGGGYSTSDGFIAEASVTERNLLGRGQYAKISVAFGQKSKGAELSFTEPFFLDRRLAAGFDIYSKYNDLTKQGYYETRTTGVTLRAGVPFDDYFSIGARYSIYQTSVEVPNTFKQPYNDCGVPIAGWTNGNCLSNGEASIAIKEARGKTITSLAGLTFVYNTRDNDRDPTSGFLIDVRPDVAGLGGDSRFGRIVADARYYYPLWDDIVGMARVHGGHVQPFGGKLRELDHFFSGANIVRGFAAGGIGPRDTSFDPRNGAIGGTTYFGATLETQFPIFGVPRELGLKGALFADAGTSFGYAGRKDFTGLIPGLCPVTVLTAGAQCQGGQLTVRDSHMIRTSVGASILWASPLGPIRFDFAQALTKDKYDRTQFFRFSGGGSF